MNEHELTKLRGDKIPTIGPYHSSDILIIGTEDGQTLIGMYNQNSDNPDLSGYYPTPHYQERINNVEWYSFAPPNTILNCSICNEEIKRSEIVGSTYSEVAKRQSYPCCPKCQKCHSFEYVGLSEEE